MDIASRFLARLSRAVLPLARPPLVTVVLATALLAAVTGASNHGPSGGDRSAQALTVGLTGAGADARAKSSAGAAAAGATAASTVSGATGQPAATTTVAPVTTTTAVAVEEEVPYEEPEPDPVRTAPPATDPPPVPVYVPAGLSRQPNVELEILTLTNMDRGSNGAPPIYRDSCLDAEASAWAHAMAESTVMAHSAAGGPAVQGCRGANASWGDNIGYWQPCFASEMEAWWMGSPSHRPHILDPTFTAVGIGVWAEPNGRCWFQVYFGS